MAMKKCPVCGKSPCVCGKGGNSKKNPPLPGYGLKPGKKGK